MLKACSNRLITSATTLGDGTWTHVGVTMQKEEFDFGDADDGTVRLYLNGTEVGNVTGISFGSGLDARREMTLSLGDTVAPNTWTTRTSEDIELEYDDLCLWEGFLPSAENMTFIYNGGAGRTCIAGLAAAGNEGGVLTSDSIVTLLTPGGGALNQTISNATNFVNVTDAKILNTTKVILTEGGGASPEPNSKSVPYIHTRDGALSDGDLFFLSVDSGIIGHRSPNHVTGNITISSISGIFSGQGVTSGTIQGIILSNVTGTNNFEDRVIEGTLRNGTLR